MGPLEVVAVIALAAAGATVQGSIGIGFALVAGAGLVAIEPAFVPGPMLLVGQVAGARHVLAEREHADVPAFRRCMIGLPVGLVVGLVVLETVDDRLLRVIVGSLTALSALALLCGLRLARSAGGDVVAGAASTFSAVAAGLPGPPLVVAFTDMKSSALRWIVSSVIMTIGAIAFVALIATGNFGWHETRLLGLLVPGALLGLAISSLVRPRVEGAWFRKVVLVVALLGGLAVALRNI